MTTKAKEAGTLHKAGRALREDLRAAVPDALAALAITASVFVFLFARAESGDSATIAVMPFMADAGTYWMYWLSQAFGWAALLWAWGTIMLGFLLAGPRPGWLPLSYVQLERLHRTTSLSTIFLMIAHAAFFAFELVRDRADLGWGSRIWDSFADSFIPGVYASGTGRIAIPIGLAALYLTIVLGGLFYFRQRIGSKTWRILHRCIIVTYALSVWHTLLYGTNVWYDEWPRTLLWALQLPIAALLLLRLLRPARRAERVTSVTPWWSARVTGRIGAGLVLLALLAVLVSGRGGGRERPPEDAASLPGPATAPTVSLRADGPHDEPLGPLVIRLTGEPAKNLHRAEPSLSAQLP